MKQQQQEQQKNTALKINISVTIFNSNIFEHFREVLHEIYSIYTINLLNSILGMSKKQSLAYKATVLPDLSPSCNEIRLCVYVSEKYMRCND